ncbi:MAG: LysM peptidoglycan-binding domain-containing protein, partial [Dehalococcoidia bacterium]|nr:LysM peptidoglycan-binding domain-containing protein [Dehalococcoidia bacterium]
GGGGGGAAPAPVATPTPTPTPTGPTVEDEPGIGSITLATGGASVETLSGNAQVVVSASAAGSDVTVSVPAGALGADGEIVVGFAADLPGLVQTAAPPAGTRILAGLVVQATAANGTAITSNFAQPVTIRVTVPAADIPPGSTAARLAFTFWNGSEWVVTPATFVINLDGSVTVTAVVTHFTVFALFRQPDVAWIGTFPITGVVLAIWQGLTGTEPLSAAGLTTSPVTAVWRMDVATQRFASWVRGAPAFVNRILTLRSGEPLILRIGDTPPRTTPAPAPAAPPAPTQPGGTSTAAVQYTVTPTDTLSGIGARFGIPWMTIAAANGIAGPNYFISTGQVLTIPGAAPATANVPPTPSTPPTPPAPSTNRTHVVLSTDTLSGIGALYGVPWLTIAAANDIPGPDYFIRTGQVLTIPSSTSTPSGSSTPTAPAATPTAPSTSGATRTHMVLSTDTLSGIGALYGVPWLTIAAANGITGPNYVISAGQVLTIPSIASPAAAPASAADGQTVVVGDGETLSQIGERLGVPWLEIAAANGITGPLYVVRSGQVLVIPGR